MGVQRGGGGWPSRGQRGVEGVKLLGGRGARSTSMEGRFSCPHSSPGCRRVDRFRAARALPRACRPSPPGTFSRHGQHQYSNSVFIAWAPESKPSFVCLNASTGLIILACGPWPNACRRA
jgi:hypothetical protein